MKKFIAFIFAALFAAGAWAHEYSATVNGVTWYYNRISDGNGGYNAEITYRGTSSSSYSNRYSGSLTIPSTLGGYKVTTIGPGAFGGCSSLTSITIPDIVTTIESYAFDGCSSLTSVTIPNSVTTIENFAFRGCSSLASITIPNSVTSIGSVAFHGTPFYNNRPNGLVILGNGYLYAYKGTCPSSITIPDSVTTIGSSVFSYCSSLTSVTIPNSVTTIKSSAFSGCSSLTSVSISDSVTTIGSEAFRGCCSLTSVTIPNSVTSIGWGAFEDCSSLTSVTIPNSVTSIGSFAFRGCSSLTSVTLPNSVTTIGSVAFYGCSSLTSVTIPNSVTEICSGAFYGCSSLTSVTIPNSVTTIGSDAFWNCSSIKEIIGWMPGCPTNVDRVVISDSVTEIEANLFSGCSSLTSITIPNSVTKIDSNAFYNCSSLKEVHINDLAKWCAISFASSYSNPCCYAQHLYLNGDEIKDLVIPDSVTSIGSNAFYGCSSLTSITIPNSVTTIGGSAFRDCRSLTSVTMPNSVTTIESSAFVGCSSLNEVHIADLAKWCAISFASSYSNPCFYAQHLYLNGDEIKDLVIPDSVTEIGSDAFVGCSSLTSITISNSVTSIGSDAFHGCSSLTSVTIPNSVTTIGLAAFSHCSSLTSVTIPDGVTKIGLYAFDGCSSLTSITISNSVTTIGGFAFRDCRSLTSVTMPGSFPLSIVFPDAYKKISSLEITSGETKIGSRAFEDCSSLTSVTIPDSVTTIGLWAFRGCSSLTTITIPNSVTSIEYAAFYNCSSLKEVHISDLAKWCAVSFGSSDANPCYYATHLYLNGEEIKDLVVPDSVTTIESSAFSGCSSLTSVSISDSVTTIGSEAFRGCCSLTSVTIPNSVTTIEREAFYDCSSLMSVTIPDSVTEIGESAFYKCISLKSITIPDSVTSIGSSAFGDCSSLTSITIPNSVTSIGLSAFGDCSSLKTVTMPGGFKASDIFPNSYRKVVEAFVSEGSTTIGLSAFSGCSSLTSVTIPNSVTEICSGAFYGCSSLTSVTIPNSVTTIGSDAFYGCRSLKSFIVGEHNSIYRAINGLICSKDGKKVVFGVNGDVVIPNGVTTIGLYAFSGCSSLTSVTIPDSVTEIGEEAFYGCSSLKEIIGWRPGCPNNVTRIVISDSVTEIGEEAFSGCSSLASVTIGNSVTSIGSSAFEDCSSLKEINVANDNFSYCSKDGILYSKNMAKLVACPGAKTSVMIPDSVTTIGLWAFRGCSSLTTITIPNSVTSIEYAAFYNCSSLKEVHISDLAKWCAVSFGSSDANPCYYAHHLYLNGEEIKDMVVPDSVTKIESSAFSGCESITSVTIPNSVTTIEREAFYDCSSLQKVILEPGSKISPSAHWGISTDKIVQQEDVNVRIKNKNDSVLYDGKSHTAQYEVVSDVDGFSAELISYEGRALPTKINVGLYTASISASDFKYIGEDIRFRNVDIDCEDSIVSLEILPRKVVIKSSDAKRIYDGAPLTNSDFEVGGDGFVDGECVISAVGSQTNVGSSPNSISVVWRNNGKASNYEITKNEGVLTITGWPKVVDGALANSFTSEVISVKEISVPDGVETVSKDIFAKMTSLRKAKFPNTLYSIDSHAFDPCSNLEWEMRGGYKFMDGWLFGYTDDAAEEIPDVDSIRGIADGALDGCMAIRRFKCSDKALLKRIPPKAFADCGRLEEVTLPEGLEQIGDEAFVGCSEVLNFIIPGTVKEIGNRAFAYCSKLTNAQVSSGVERIGDEAFLDCWQIEDVDIPSTVAWVGTNAFGGDSSIIRAGMRGDIRRVNEVFSNYRHIREFIIKPGTGALKDCLFYGCEELKDVRILGDCPEMENDGQYLYANAGKTSEPITTYVTQGSYGWNGRKNSTALPQAWPLIEPYRHSIVYWDVPTYLCVFHSNGGSLGNQKTYQKSEQPFKLPATPTQSGYAFLGWYTSPVGGIRITEKNIFIEGVYQDLYAHWGKARKIVLDANGGAIELGTVVLVEQTTYGVLPAPVRTGYAFGGWTYNGKTIVPNTSILSETDHKLVAQWEALKYKVVFNANYGVGEADDMICEYNKDYVAPKSGFVMSGKKLIGWSLEPRGSVDVKIGAKFRNLASEEGRVITLYAVYEYDSNYVEKAPLILKTMEGSGSGTFSGAGDYPSGKKVTLKATASKGSVFSGWYKDGELISNMASYAMTTDGKYTVIFGKFISAEEDKESIAVCINDAMPDEYVDEFAAITLPVGVAVNWSIEATALSATTVKAAKLPAGLKLVQDKETKEYSIQGIPTKAAYTVAAITVTTAGKNSRVFVMPITTTAKPTWAVGTFNGGLVDSEGEECGLVTLTTTAAGKISGKILKKGQTWTVSATSFDSFDKAGYHATLTAKSGKLAPETYEIVISEEGVSGSNEANETIEAYWNSWKTAEGKIRGKDLAANPEIKKNGLPLPEGFDLESYGLASLTLKFAASGAVTATGMFDVGAYDKKGNPSYYKATCSTVLISTKEGYRVYLYFVPNSKKNFDGEAFSLELFQ